MARREITHGDNERTAIPPVLLCPEQVARVLGIGRTKVYELMASGALRSVKLGGSRRVSASALDDFVASLEAGEGVG